MIKSISTLILCSSALLAIGQGESCATAEAVAINNSYQADGPATGGGCFNCTDNAQNADWYIFTAAQDGFASVSSCDDPDGIDTRFWVYSGDCSGLISVAAGDDDCGVGTTFASYAEFQVVAGTDYYVEWDDTWTTEGFLWRLLFADCPLISNLNVDATATTSVDLSWMTSMPGNLATLEYGAPGFLQGNGTIVMSANGIATISGLTIDTDYQVYVFETCPDNTVTNTLGVLDFSTDSLSPPDNDDCINSISVACGEVVEGITSFANTSLNGEFCGTTIDSPGIWYSIVGDGSLLIASTCDMADYDTKISVFTNECDSLICIDGNDDNFPCANNTSEVSWQSNIGEQYFLLIHGFNGQTGTFMLEVSCNTCPEPEPIILDITSNSIDISWDPITPSSDFIIEYGLGGFIPGSGTTVTGSSGIDGPPFTISGIDAITNYSFYILQDCGIDGLSDTSIVVDFTTDDVPPLNDLCIDAFLIECDTTVSGNTTFASIDTTDAPDCGSINVAANGVWYRIEGNGGQMTASTCNISAYDTKLTVYSGTCGVFECIAGNDDAVGPDGNDCTGNSSIVSWPSQVGTTYYILVHGYALLSTGGFNMEVTCSEPCAPVPDNQACGEAISILLSLTDSCTYLNSTNVCASFNLNNPSCDPFGIIQDVWYSFNSGANSEVLIDFSLTSATNGSFSIYEDCNSLEIYCSNDIIGPELVSGLLPNTNYLLQFWNGGSSEDGEMDLCISADLISGVEESFFSSMIIFPNPSNDLVNIDIKDLDLVQLHIYDLRGVIIDETILRNGKNAMDVVSWPSGLYILSFIKDGHQTIKKLAKH